MIHSRSRGSITFCSLYKSPMDLLLCMKIICSHRFLDVWISWTGIGVRSYLGFFSCVDVFHGFFGFCPILSWYQYFHIPCMNLECIMLNLGLATSELMLNPLPPLFLRTRGGSFRSMPTTASVLSFSSWKTTDVVRLRWALPRCATSAFVSPVSRRQLVHPLFQFRDEQKKNKKKTWYAQLANPGFLFVSPGHMCLRDLFSPPPTQIITVHNS